MTFVPGSYLACKPKTNVIAALTDMIFMVFDRISVGKPAEWSWNYWVAGLSKNHEFNVSKVPELEKKCLVIVFVVTLNESKSIVYF